METQEQAETTTEQEVTQAIGELDTTSTEEAEASAESAEGEAESEEEGKKVEEESFEDKVGRLAQSMKDKELKPYYKELNDLKNQNTELQTQLNNKVWDRHLGTLFNEDVENLGEDDAKTRKEDRQKVAEQVKEFQLKKAQVEKLEAELNEKMPRLGIIERDQKAKSDLWSLLFPEDKVKIAQLDTHLKKFEKAKDWDDYDIIFEGIKEVIKGKKTPFVPDSSQSGTGAGVGFSSSPEDKVTKGIEAIKRKQR